MGCQFRFWSQCGDGSRSSRAQVSVASTACGVASPSGASLRNEGEVAAWGHQSCGLCAIQVSSSRALGNSLGLVSCRKLEYAHVLLVVGMCRVPIAGLGRFWESTNARLMINLFHPLGTGVHLTPQGEHFLSNSSVSDKLVVLEYFHKRRVGGMRCTSFQPAEITV